MEHLISICARGGIAEWVCCPGAKNSTFIAALARCGAVHKWQLQDERSAGFFALGRMQATARSVGVVAGSGANAAALLPAVVEAYYERLPLLILSIDETPCNGAAGAFGRIDQENLYGTYAPTVTVHLPCTDTDYPHVGELCADGFPIHLRLVYSDGYSCGSSERSEYIQVADAPPRPHFRGSLAALSQMLRFRAREEGVVLLLGALDPDEQECALWLARTLRCPVLADATSGLREKLADRLLQGGSDLLTDNPPRNVLRLGAVPSFPFWQALEEMPRTEVYSIVRSGFSGLHRESFVIEGEPEQVVRALGDVPHIGDPAAYLPRGKSYAGRVEELLFTYPESDAALVNAYSRIACSADVCFLGSPSSIALWNTFAQIQHPTLYVRSATLAGGSDGAMAAFLGNAVDAPVACALMGDIALLRDFPCAAEILPRLPHGKRIVAVLNNDGAGLVPSGIHSELRNLLAQPPATTVRDIARLSGAEYYPIHCEADLDVTDTQDPSAFILLELLPDDEQSCALRRALP